MVKSSCRYPLLKSKTHREIANGVLLRWLARVDAKYPGLVTLRVRRAFHFIVCQGGEGEPEQ